MEFEIDRIPNNGLDFDISVNADEFEIKQDECFLEEPVAVKGEIKLLKKEVYFKGKTKANLRLACSRCLAPFKHLVETNVFARFIPRTKSDDLEMERQMLEEEIDAEFYSNSKVNLIASVRDAILLALPIIQLCKKDCLGLCSECGQNLNESQCKCGDNAAIDPRFEKLKQLKEKLQHKENN
jgi:uncharacterized protein